MFPSASTSLKCFGSPFSAPSLKASKRLSKSSASRLQTSSIILTNSSLLSVKVDVTISQRRSRLCRRGSLNVKERRQVAVVKVASNANNGDGASDSNRSFIERDANKSARVLQNQKPMRFGFIGWIRRISWIGKIGWTITLKLLLFFLPKNRNVNHL